MPKHTISAEEARQLFSYNPETGDLVWVKSCGSVSAGSTAGTKRSDNYITLQIYGKRYLAHRIAWLLHYGKWPEKLLDHIDGNPSNNSIANLREASYSQNNCNAKRRKNTSGFKGVSWWARDKKWQVHIHTETGRKFLGYFPTPEEAYAAYCKAAREHYGEFANTG